MKTVHSVISLEGMAEEEGMTALDKLIVKAYCDELTAAFQYLMAKHQARGNGYADVIPEYDQHMEDEEDHAKAWLERLEQKGIILRLDLCQVAGTGNPWTPIQTSDIKEQLNILIKAEADARDFYSKIVSAARESEDWITERIAKEYMSAEEEHRNDLQRLLEGL